MPPTKAKAKKMLKEGKARGKTLTKKQKGLFGAIAGGNSKVVAKKKKSKKKKGY